MIFDELKQYLIANSSQYNIQEIEIDDDNLKRIVDRVLKIYSNYKPLKTTQRFYVPKNHYQIKEVNDRPVIDIKNIYMVDPYIVMGAEDIGGWSFNKSSKTLHTLITGNLYIKFRIQKILDDILPDEDDFLEMVLGQFLISIGTARENFKMTDLPIEINASELKADGKDIYDNAFQRLTEVTQDWWDAIG